MVPGADIVAGPGGSISLSAGVSSARENEGTLVGAKGAQAVVSGTDILHAVEVVDGAMFESSSVVEAMEIIERHGFGGGQKKGWLIHIVPEARHAHIDEIVEEAAPPGTHTGQREIRKDACARPNVSDIERAIGLFHKRVVLDPGVIGRIAVAGIFLDMQINNQNGVKILRGEILDHLLERRKALPVDGEGGIALLVVDIEVDGVARNLFVAESFRPISRTRASG